MSAALTPPRAALGGTAVLMACACGTAANTVKLLALGEIGATTTLVHPIFLGVGAALVSYGLWRTSKHSGALALVAFAVLAGAAVLTPPRVMSTKALPWDVTHVAGAALYLVAAVLLAYAFWRAFPSRRPAASGTAMGGVVLATGCSCCMVTGALAGLAVTAGGSAGVWEQSPVLFWTGLAIVAAGLFRLGGVRAAIWVPVGGAIIRYGPELLKLTGDWMMGGVNLRFAPAYLVTIAGAATLLYGFVVAYRTPASQVTTGQVTAGSRPTADEAEQASEPVLAGV